MIEPMVKVHVIGHRRRLDHTLRVLHGMRLVHLLDVTDDPTVRLPPLSVDEDALRRVEELRYLRARLEALLALVPGLEEAPATPVEELDVDALRAELAEVGPRIEELTRSLDELEAEQEVLPRHLASLRRVLPLVSESVELEGYDTDVVILDARRADVLADLNVRLMELLGGNFEIISDQIDRDTVGAVLVFPRRERPKVQTLLGGEQLSRVRLPRRFEGMPFRQAISAMERRLVELPGATESLREQISELVRPHAAWTGAVRAISARLEQMGAVRRLGATPHTFVVSGWVPRRSVLEFENALAREVGPEVLVEEVDPEPGDRPPVLMRNPAPVRPFEFLVRLLAVPRYGSLDPSRLMTLFLPLFFGMMLGDVAYGLILFVIAALVVRRMRTRSKTMADLGRVLFLSAGWTVVWGVVYGELLGDLGRRWLGMRPLWIDREQALEPLLLFALAVGAAHVTLGLVLGVWQAAHAGERRQMGERIATLGALAGLFLIAAVATGRLPHGVITPGVAVILAALVVLVVLEGPLGLLMAPLELVGTVGNVLSYLRIAAIGLASVYLARVANELGGTGPLWLGITVAALFHALNLALGAFSPTIQALRLHYVEFFGKFYDEEGGEAFHAFGSEEPADGTPASVP